MNFKHTFLSILFFVSIILFSCGNKIIVCASSSVDVAFFAEQFNAVQNKEKILFLYFDDTRESLNLDQIPDIIIDHNIIDIHGRINLKDLSSTLGNKKRYYKGLLNCGKIHNRQRFVPLSFNLPILSYKHTQGNNEYPPFLDLHEIEKYASPLNQATRYEYKSIGFSPFWDLEALYMAYRLLGLQFSTKNELFSFPQEILTQSHEKVQKWLEKLVPDLLMEEFFRDKYRNTSGDRLIQEELVRFFFYTTNSYFKTTPQVQKENLFSWLSLQNQVLAIEDFLYAAIPNNANNSRGAKKFLKWLLSEKTQKFLIDKKIEIGYESFGLCDGFSPLKAVNEKKLSSLYPAFALSPIPKEEQIIFPKSMPIGYPQAKKQVIEPWLYKNLLGTNEMDLGFEINRWVNQQILYH